MRWIPALLVSVFACASDDPTPNGLPNDCVERVASPAPSHNHLDGGGSYAGRGCLDSGCHLNGFAGVGTTGFVAGGAVVTGDGQPEAGVTIRLRPLDNSAVTAMVTDAAGTFFLRSGTTNPFPATPEVTACPKVARMLEAPPDSGNCNGTDCHTSNGHAGRIVLDD